MLSEKSWKSHKAQAAHYEAIGETTIYLYNDQDPPWQHADFCEAGCSHRLDIATSVNFKAHVSGLIARGHSTLSRVAQWKRELSDRCGQHLKVTGEATNQDSGSSSLHTWPLAPMPSRKKGARQSIRTWPVGNMAMLLHLENSPRAKQMVGSWPR